MGTFLTYFLGLLVVGGALYAVAAFAFGRGEELAPMPPDVTPVALPDGRPVTARDVRRLRISVVVRGYKMHEVDWILGQLAGQFEQRDREIAKLRDERDEAWQELILVAERSVAERSADTTPDAAGEDGDTEGTRDARPGDGA